MIIVYIGKTEIESVEDLDDGFLRCNQQADA